MSLMQKIQSVWQTTKGALREQPTAAMIPADHVIDADFTPTLIVPKEHYFEVIINEMFLERERQLWVNVDPAVYIVTDFIYKGEMTSVPYLVSPLKLPFDNVPNGMIFRNTRVAGTHPYRGGQFGITLVLYRVSRNGVADRLLDFISSAASAHSFANALGAYMQLADVVVGGVQTLLGLNGMSPLIGIQEGFNATTLRSGFFVLINEPGVPVSSLWVDKGQLLKGDTKESAKPYRDADYVLYSIRNDTTRTDTDMLQFAPLWDQVRQEALKSNNDEVFTNTKVLLANLYQQVEISPDLTQPQADQLSEEFRQRVSLLRKKAINNSNLSTEPGAKESGDITSDIRRTVGDILNME